MYDELYDPIPNLDQYLERLGLKQPDKCDLNFLDSMILAHQYYIPFENIDSYDDKLPVSLATEKLFEKIVTRKRGGYCFELNALFAKALEACGYNIKPYLARIIVGDDFSIPSLHRLTVVEIENENYVCDVGFGGIQPGFALKVKDGYTRTDVGQTFRIDKIDGRWQVSHLLRTEEKWEPTMEFFANDVKEVDFVTPNFYCSTHGDSLFVTNRVINIRTPNGSKSIFDNQFAINEDGKRTEIEIKDDEQLNELLVSHFGIER